MIFRSRKQVQLAFKNGADSICMNILIYTPNKKLKAPVFLGYNFAGNYLLHKDPFILIDGKKESELTGDSYNKFNVKKRGERTSRWAIEKIIESGSKKLENEANKTREELKQQLSSIVVETASKIIDEEIDEKKHENIIKKAAEEI